MKGKTEREVKAAKQMLRSYPERVGPLRAKTGGGRPRIISAD
jgi:hypothetical protein